MLSAKKTGWLAICAALIAVLLVSSFPFVGVPLGSKSSGNLISIAYAQDGCEGCSNSYPEHIKAKADWENCADEDKVRYYQRYLAASNKFTQCLNRGCDTGTGGPTATPDNGGGDLPPVCGDGICEIDKGESCANCLSDCPCSSGEACQPSDSNADAFGCVIVAVPKGMALTVSTVKDTYSPGETVIVQGSVKEAKGNAIPDVSLVIEITPVDEGTGLPTSTGTMQDATHYESRIPLPKTLSEGTYTVKVTASKKDYPTVSRTNIFNVGLPKISLCPSTVPGGDVKKTIEIVGSDFSAHEEIKIVLDGTVVAEISADAVGSFRVKLDIPKNEKMGAAGEKHTIEAIGMLHTANAEFTVGPSLDDIMKIWRKWGEEEGEWPDGSTDTHRLFHHSPGGGFSANLAQSIPGSSPNMKQEASHFGCIACQWKTLYFFVQQAREGNLGGWEFMPLAAWSPSVSEVFGHHAVVLYPAHAKWQTDGWVFDPHAKGTPEISVWKITAWDDWRFWLRFDGYKFDPYWFGGKIVDGSFVRDYDLGCGFKDAYHYHAYWEFPDAYVDDWMTPEETEKYQVEYDIIHHKMELQGYGGYDYDTSCLYVNCPVNVLVVNSAGERLGLTENDEWISEFKPEKFDTWPGDDNTPVWYFELPKGDTYAISITGTGSGDLEVFAVPEGSKVVFKYPPVEVSAGDKFSMKLDASDPGTPLDTPGGQVSPTEIPIEEFIAVVEPIEGNNPPTASFSIMPENPTPEDTIIGASTSSDPDGDTLTYSWYRDGSEIENSPNWEWENPQAGEYNIKLVVDDGKGGSDEYSTKIKVIGPTDIPGFEIGIGTGDKTNNPPIASFYIMPQNPKTSDTIVVASTSFDPDDDKLTYSWYRDGIYLTEIGDWSDWEWENPQAGGHTIKLVVDDGKGGSDEDSTKIKVIGPTPTDTPGFEIAFLIGAIIVALIVIKRRKHNL